MRGCTTLEAFAAGLQSPGHSGVGNEQPFDAGTISLLACGQQHHVLWCRRALKVVSFIPGCVLSMLTEVSPARTN